MIAAQPGAATAEALALGAPPSSACVLDASALLASVFNEPGGSQVRALIPHAMMSAANWSEFFQKVQQKGIETTGMRSELEGAGLEIMPVTAEQAEMAAQLWPLGRSAGLSLGDRLCLALAQQQHAVAYTTDRAWTGCTLPVRVVCVRPLATP